MFTLQSIHYVSTPLKKFLLHLNVHRIFFFCLTLHEFSPSYSNTLLNCFSPLLLSYWHLASFSLTLTSCNHSHCQLTIVIHISIVPCNLSSVRFHTVTPISETISIFCNNFFSLQSIIFIQNLQPFYVQYCLLPLGLGFLVPHFVI